MFQDDLLRESVELNWRRFVKPQLLLLRIANEIPASDKNGLGLIMKRGSSNEGNQHDINLVYVNNSDCFVDSAR